MRRFASFIAAVLLANACAARELRVCADPNNLPFSNERGEGFDNRIAALLARDLGAHLVTTWWAQRRGAVRNTLGAGSCDLMMGVPNGAPRLATTQPYYRARYVFVTRRADALNDLRDLDDPRLRKLTVGVQLAADHLATPPGQLLARRGITDNVRGFPITANYAQRDPQQAIVHAVAAHAIDVALVWGPVAGYFARREREPLTIAPIGDDAALPLEFALAIGVRKDDTALREELDAALARNRAAIEKVLRDYGVPLAR